MRVVITLILVLINCSFAKDIKYTGENPILLLISKKDGAEVIFPSEVLKIGERRYFDAKILGGNKKGDKRVLTFKSLKENASERILITLSDTSKVVLDLKNVNEKYGKKVKKKYNLIKENASKRFSDRGTVHSKYRTLSLLKAMKNNEYLTNYTIHKLSIPIRDGHKDLHTKLVKTYISDHLFGYELLLDNTGDDTLVIDYENLRVSNPDMAKISFATAWHIGPKEKITYYIVTEYGTDHGMIRLAVRKESNKE